MKIPLQIQGCEGLLHIMKITILQIFIAGLFVSMSYSNDLNGQNLLDQEITIQVQDVQLKNVLSKIEQLTTVKFGYSPQIISETQHVSIQASGLKLKEVLNRLLLPLGISYQVISDRISLYKTSVSNVSESESVAAEGSLLIEVSGKVTDETGHTMPGVSVIEKGTTNGTSTDADGNYKLNVNENATLIFSFIGYSTEEQAIGSLTTIDISLKPSVETLSEVIVVGYGTQKRRDVTGSIVSVTSEALQEVPAANMQQALQGRAAGLEVQRVGTTPGSGAQIRIRGERSILGSNNPLIVLDGIPFDNGDNTSLTATNAGLNDINPDDIASIEVLKDASATAIYGSRGANGVILVTTKRGKSGPTKLSFNSYYGINSAARKYPVYNAQEYRAMRDISPWTQGYQPEELTSIANGQSTDWQNLMYQRGFITDNNLTLSGGNDNSQFSVGGGYFKETTILPGQDFTRGTLKMTGDFKVGKRIKIGLNSLDNYSVTNGSQFVNPMFSILALSPLMPAYDINGQILKTPFGNADDRSSSYSPLLLKHNNNNWVDKVSRIRTFNSAYAEYSIIDGLKYRLNVGLDYSHQESDQFQGSDSYFRPLRGNTASVNNSENIGYTLENLLTYEKVFAEKHRLSATALYSRQENHTHNVYISKDSISDDFVQFYNLGASNQSVSSLPTYSGGEQTFGLVSLMGRINYTYDNRFMITLTGRSDGSSRLAVGNKTHKYPAISAGWNISNESFMQNLTVVSNLKLRVGYGETSNQAVSPYASLGGVSNTILNGTTNVPIKYNFGNQIVGGYYVSSIPNKNLDWEYTRTTNIGLDFGVLKDRITGAIDVYNAFTYKILYGLALPASSGVAGNFNENIGKMENKGLEVTISSVNIKSSNGFTWSSDLNFFLNRNKLLSLNDGFQRNIANGLYVGQPLTAIYDYKKLGIWQLNEAAEAASFGQVPGQLKIADISGADGGGPDGKIDVNDRTIIGSGQAKWQGGMTNRFSYKGFDFSFVTYARFGGTLISGVHQPTAAYVTVLNGQRNGLKVDYWTPTNPTNSFPMPSTQITPPGATTAWTTLGYYDASFVKIRSINLGYTIPRSVLSRIKAQSVRVYVTAQNPFLLYSPYVKAGGVDPEATGTGTTGFVQNGGNIPNRALTIALNTPPTRAFIVGVNLSF